MKQYSGEIDVVEVCTDDLAEISEQAGVLSIPTIQFYYKGEMLETIVGCVAKVCLRVLFFLAISCDWLVCSLIGAKINLFSSSLTFVSYDMKSVLANAVSTILDKTLQSKSPSP